VAERVRRTIAGEPFLGESTPEALTASLGVAAFPEHGRTAEALLEAADRAMRRVKVHRKNAIGMPQEDLSRREAP
jgi:diguanylate cyclase (GGDEF)-like protein